MWGKAAHESPFVLTISYMHTTNHMIIDPHLAEAKPFKIHRYIVHLAC